MLQHLRGPSLPHYEQLIECLSVVRPELRRLLRNQHQLHKMQEWSVRLARDLQELRSDLRHMPDNSNYVLNVSAAAYAIPAQQRVCPGLSK